MNPIILKKNRVLIYEEIGQEQEFLVVYQSNFLKFIKKFILVKLDFYIKYINHYGNEEKYKVSILPPVNLGDHLFKYTLLLKKHYEIECQNLISYIDINFVRNFDEIYHNLIFFNSLKYQPLFLFLYESDYSLLDKNHILKGIIDNEYRKLSIEFFCKIFFIRENFIEKRYEKYLYVFYVERFNKTCDPLEYLEQHILHSYDYKVSKDYIIEIQNHFFFELFKISKEQKIIIDNLNNNLDILFSKFFNFLIKNYNENEVLDYKITISNCSFFGSKNRLLSIFEIFDDTFKKF